MTPRRRRAWLLIAPFSAVLVAAACGSDAGHRGPKAAEPATAPVPSTEPVGRIAKVGARPEGIVYDARTRLLAVAVRAPDRLLLLDPRTLAPRRSVALPGGVRHLQLGRPGGPVLVPVESAARIVQVSLPGGATRSTAVRKQPHDAAEATNGDVVVGNEFGRSISVIHDGVVVRTFADLRQPGGVVAAADDVVGVVDVGAFTLSTYDLDAGRRTGRVAAGAGPTHGVLVGGDRIAVTDTRGDRLLVFSLHPLRQVGTLALGGAPYGIATDSDTGLVWVTLTARNEVVGLAVSGDVPRVVARYPTVRQPNTVAVAPGSQRLWVTGTAGGVVQLITR
ncbi:hypothetical protein SAMN05443575_3556 [Jatrophihabitans endophyticus]|uniref:DNA-binding beta-propeller fold protein YncE n=1 Tax=Jatrophihabitans endophyticus TaxID=1206085 RepID=A0A1M5RIL4_9ACTN|nr:hypothetical protein [Jatrophihabitans endophyticus]SHH25899.1 hypothetical protein SAMN05443575_3556 [Jatrophihabitans endophyticus]